MNPPFPDMVATGGRRFGREEGIALGVAVAAHVALLAALAFGNLGKDTVPPPVRMTVTLSNDIAAQSTSPDPMAQPMPDVAPQLGEAQPEPAPELQPQPQPQPQQKNQPAVQPQPQPAQKAVAKPAPANPVPAAAKAATKPAPRPTAVAGGSRIGNDFLKGIPAATASGTSRNQPAAVIGEQAKISARNSIRNEVLPFWNRCSVDGVDIERLRVRIVIHMDPVGRVLSMDPPMVDGKTPANSPQIARFVECAQNAIRSASPFALSPDSYEFWKNYPVLLRKQREN